MADPLDVFKRQEDLVPEFDQWVSHDATLGMCIQHPLYYSIMHHPMMNAYANAALKQKKAAVKEAEVEERWHRYVLMHERPWRFEALTRIADRITSIEEYWSLVSFIWIDSENIWQHHDQWVELFNAREREEQWRMMDTEESDGLDALPEVIPVYRGTAYAERIHGLSWTLDRDKAVWFAERFGTDTPLLAEGAARKHLVIAYFTSRGEEEIVVMPNHVNVKEVTQLCS